MSLTCNKAEKTFNTTSGVHQVGPKCKFLFISSRSLLCVSSWMNVLMRVYNVTNSSFIPYSSRVYYVQKEKIERNINFYNIF